MNKVKLIKIIILLGLTSLLLSSCKSINENDSWNFVSMPDFLNVDCDYPQPGWEDALSYILESVNKENPDFLAVAGDIVMMVITS